MIIDTYFDDRNYHTKARIIDELNAVLEELGQYNAYCEFSEEDEITITRLENIVEE